MSTNSLSSEATIQILLVEDDVRLSALIQEYLQKYSIDVAIEQRGDHACRRILQDSPDLVILDLMLPGMDGLEVCRTIRPKFDGPILMLTARDEDIDQVVGLEIGADDYVTKPVLPRVLLARIRALLRRYPKHQSNQEIAAKESNEYHYGVFKISAAAHEARLHGKIVNLTDNEFDLLWLMASHPGEILSREAILENLRGIDYDGIDRSVDIRISRLRKKLGDDTNQPSRIKTIRGKGYLFVKEAWEGE